MTSKKQQGEEFIKLFVLEKLPATYFLLSMKIFTLISETQEPHQPIFKTTEQISLF